ncbi:cytochrome P450 [Streptomyces sp. NPDC048057]|uniref:cytochrome P450 family protein n=1 Tax=Streptomyces sp. NPDC048057 TaxID=3155628 RepID=UPI0033ED91D0
MTTTLDLSELPGFREDPYPYYAKLRARGPVHRVRDCLRPVGDPNGHFWLIVGHEEAHAALVDPRLIKNPQAVGFSSADMEIIGPSLLQRDPPHHTRLRKLISREFTARRMQQLAPRIQQITDELLDAMVPAGRADLVTDFAFPLPITVICELLGVPMTDRDSFRALSNELVAPTDLSKREDSLRYFVDYLDDLIADKRSGGGSDDLLSALIRTRDEGDDHLTGPELRALAHLLLIAGHETTVNLIVNGVRALLAHPEQLAALRADFTLLDGAIEEVLRYDGPVETATHRFTAEPVEIADTVIPAGEMVVVGLGPADRDPTRFPDPDRFDIHRDARGHIAFGHGIHFCIGAPLARLEARIALKTLFTRCPELAVDPSAEPLDWLPGLLIRGVRNLPVRF